MLFGRGEIRKNTNTYSNCDLQCRQTGKDSALMTRILEAVAGEKTERETQGNMTAVCPVRIPIWRAMPT